MKTIEIQLYKFSELSEEAKQTAHEKHLNNFEPAWMEEYIETLIKGLQSLNCEIGRYSIDYSSANQSYVPFQDYNQHTEELSGQRLRTWLLNNYYDVFFERKPQGEYKKNEQTGKWNYKRRSKITFVETSYPFTGYCGDENFLDAFRAFLSKPNNSTFQELVEDAIQNTLKAMEVDYEYQCTLEHFEEEAEANGYEFTEDGERY